MQTLYQYGYKHCNNSFVKRTVTTNGCQKCIMPANILPFIEEITLKSEKLFLTFSFRLTIVSLCNCVKSVSYVSKPAFSFQ